MRHGLAGLLAGALFTGMGPCAWAAIQSSDLPIERVQPQIPYGARVAADDHYDAYYDGGYGTYADGYWGTDGGYWYLSAPSGDIWARDEEGHFRRTPARGFALVRGTACSGSIDGWEIFASSRMASLD
jgi:hypothetical protein